MNMGLGMPRSGAYLEIKPAKSYCLLAAVGFLVVSVVFLVLAVWHRVFLSLALFGLLLGGYRYFLLRSTSFILTEETLKTKKGLFNINIETLELYRVKDYIVNQSFLLRLLNLMTLTLITTDKSEQVVVLGGIPQSNLNDVIRDLVQKARRKGQIVELN